MKKSFCDLCDKELVEEKSFHVFCGVRKGFNQLDQNIPVLPEQVVGNTNQEICDECIKGFEPLKFVFEEAEKRKKEEEKKAKEDLKKAQELSKKEVDKVIEEAKEKVKEEEKAEGKK